MRDYRSTDYSLQLSQFSVGPIMIMTTDAAEMGHSRFLSSDESYWNWAELAIQEPYFLIKVFQDLTDTSVGSHLITSDVRFLVDLKTNKIGNSRIDVVTLLIPSYLNGTNSYTAQRLLQIWSSQDGNDHLFVLADGHTVRHSMSGEDEEADRMKLIFDMRT